MRGRGSLTLLTGVPCTLIAAFAFVRPALAHQVHDPAAQAEALFRAGKEQLAQHQYARACPLLEESYELDPGTGALLALAICLEGQGKLASAAATYEKVAMRAAEEQRTDRVQVARQRGTALQHQISTITIEPPVEASLPGGFSIRRDGVPVDAAQFGAPLPCDGGVHIVEITASGKKPWRTRLWLAPAGDRRTVNIPALEDASGEAPAVAAAPPLQPARPAMLISTTSSSAPVGARERNVQPLTQVSASAERTEPPGGRPRLRLTGIALTAAGAATLGVGTFYGIRAMLKQESSQQGCTGNVCSPPGKADRLAALSAGDRATIAFIAGGALAAAGGALMIIAHHRPAVRLGNQALLRGGFTLSPAGAGLVLEARSLR